MIEERPLNEIRIKNVVLLIRGYVRQGETSSYESYCYSGGFGVSVSKTDTI